ncbi:MAG: carbohydrate kinase, partial [Propionicimonas sp.]|nr:carbohydrate kinase [Propionicimonas sp.]
MDAPVTVVGEALIDIVIPLDGQVAEYVGGSPANVAIGLARLGHQVELATHLGRDQRGDRIAALLATEEVTLAPGSTTAVRTSTAAARLDETGAASYTFDLDWQVDPALPVADGGHLHTGSIAAVLPPGGADVHAIVEAARPHATISYDPTARPSLMGSAAGARAVVESLVALADVVKASDEDLHWLYPGVPVEEVLRGWTARGPRLVAATQGGSEVVVLFGDEVHRIPTRSVAVVDTVGAGDSFMSGLISGLLDAGLLGGTAARARLATAGWDEVSSA